jgi:hypothetical protein
MSKHSFQAGWAHFFVKNRSKCLPTHILSNSILNFFRENLLKLLATYVWKNLRNCKNFEILPNLVTLALTLNKFTREKRKG